MDKKKPAVPKYLIVIILILVACLIFLVAVRMPFAQKLPVYTSNHESATAEINKYKDYLARYDEVEKSIQAMKLEFEEKSKSLYIKPNETADDIRDMLNNVAVNITSFNVSEGVEDDSGAISATGDPLYNTTISVNFDATRQKMIETFRYFESESKGSYYISSISVSKDVPDTSGETSIKSSEETFTVHINIFLYYFNEEMNKGVPVATSDESASSAA